MFEAAKRAGLGRGGGPQMTADVSPESLGGSQAMHRAIYRKNSKEQVHGN